MLLPGEHRMVLPDQLLMALELLQGLQGAKHQDRKPLQEQRRVIEEAGYVPVYAMGPAIKPKPYLRALVRHEVVPVIFDFHRPDVHPELFDPQYRFDDDHLNVAGARLYSEVFAEAFADWLDTGAAPP